MRKIQMPAVIRNAIEAGAVIAHSVSGGKDSQALVKAVAGKYTDKEFAIHMDLGKAEWPQTPGHVERLTQDSGLPLTVVSRPQGDLVDQIQARMQKLEGTGKPFWPSSANRYCTADQKRGQADKVYRQHNLIISAEGIRGDESPKRKKDPVVSIREQITGVALRDMSPERALAAWLKYPEESRPRLALTWNPIHAWDVDDVWKACGTSSAELAKRQAAYREGKRRQDGPAMAAALDGWVGHPAYVFGNKRLSCALCVLADDNDIRNGAEHNPRLAAMYLEMESATGCTFKSTKSLASIIGAT